MANNSIEKCLSLIQEISDTVENARKAFMGKDECIVNRPRLLECVHTLENSLPSVVQAASDYAHNIQRIQQDAEQQRNATIMDARQRATQMLSEAQQQASDATSKAERAARDTLAKAQSDANATIEAARSEANRILEDAQRRAQVLVSQEEIVRRARVEASEAKQNMQEELALLRQNTFDYLDGVMEQLDRHLSKTVSDLRLERSELNNHRT